MSASSIHHSLRLLADASFSPHHQFSANGSKTYGLDLVQNITTNSRRYVQLFCEVIDSLLPEETKDLSDRADVLDTVQEQRKQANERDRLARIRAGEQDMGEGEEGVTPAELDIDEGIKFPPVLLRR